MLSPFHPHPQAMKIVLLYIPYLDKVLPYSLSLQMMGRQSEPEQH